jgi:hypothetical protein
MAKKLRVQPVKLMTNIKKFQEEAKTFTNGLMITKSTLNLALKVSRKLAMAILFSLSENFRL